MEAALGSPQFVGRTRSVVYASLCYEPFSNLYSIAADGSGLQEIAAIKPYATQPALSPDGSEIAYSWAKFTGFSCKGCASEIRVAGADGSNTRVLTNPSMDCTFDFSPTWSPDGQTILYSEGSCDSPGELFTVQAAGGTPPTSASREPVPPGGRRASPTRRKAGSGPRIPMGAIP